MCTNYTPSRHDLEVRRQLGLTPGPGIRADGPAAEAYPGSLAPLVLRQADGRVDEVEARFGLVPAWCKDIRRVGATYNARGETASERPSFRGAWRQRRFGLALADDFFENRFETGAAVRWRIRRADDQPMGIACLWDTWVEPGTGECLTSFAMLTVNADAHPLLRLFHRADEEKRMPVILAPGQFDAWLRATPQTAGSLLQACPADWLQTEAAPRTRRTRPVPMRGSAQPAVSAQGQPGLFD